MTDNWCANFAQPFAQVHSKVMRNNGKMGHNVFQKILTGTCISQMRVQI